MSRRLDDLSPAFKPKAIELLARCVESGIPIMIVDTLRTATEQAENIRKGVSWTQHSKHITGDAMDVCPYETYLAYGKDKLLWDADDPTWMRIGLLAEALGLRWGGRWKKRDMGHVELVKENA